MSIAEQVARIRGEKSKIAIKLSTMGLAEQTADLETLADAIDGIPDKGAVTATVREGETYTIPKGYHNGSGTVSGINNPDLDAREFMLQTKPITPTKSQQSVTPDQGYYGLSSVTVNAIPAAFQDVSQVDATKDDVLAGKKIVKSDGTVVVGEMPNYGFVEEHLSYGHENYAPVFEIKKGYYEGGTVDIIPETPPAITPTKESQRIAASPGKVLDCVHVSPIPDKYQDITGVTALEPCVMEGFKYVNADGNLVDGTMRVYREQITIDALTKSSVSLPNGYYASVDVTITDDLENALKEI